MNKLFFPFLLFFIVNAEVIAQPMLSSADKSIMDASYCPPNFPLLKIQDKVTEPLLARIVYSRPQKNGRIIFGDLIPYGKVWRLGANEATEIEFFQNAKFGNVSIKKGRYTIYAIPAEAKWTFIINKETDVWGSFRYDSKKDVARVDVPVLLQNDISELFTILFEKSDKGYELQFFWDNIKTTVPVSL